MTDERSNSSNKNTNTNNNCNNASNNNNSSTSNSSERIIAEAAKIWLKNGLNGTNAAAAATLLTAAAAATFQLPAPPPLFNAVGATPLKPPSKSVTSSTSTTNGLLAPSTKQTIETSTSIASSTRTMATTVTAANALVASAHKTDVGVIDYTQSSNSAASVSASKSTSLQMLTSHHFESGRQSTSSPSGNSNCGGRLQFFKDGKFILELARSKDGERGGWVSVPRKSFRAPSAATSATVTPTSATPLTYPKNENSTSLSFSDDNSSIQSSPWQRDHSWKQSRPRRGISKEMALFYQRPKNIILTTVGVKTASKRRRKPYESTKTALELFQRVEKSMLDSSNGKLDVAAKSKGPSSPEIDSKSNKGSPGTTNDTDTKCIVSTVDDVVGNDFKDGTAKKALVEPIKDEQKKAETEPCDERTEQGLDSAVIEKMNTNEDENAMSVMAGQQLKEEAKASANGEIEASESKHETKCLVASGEANVNKRLYKKRKPRAKLCTIIQKLIDSVPARLEQLSKTPIIPTSGTGGGAISNLNHLLAHKVSPPSSTATRLVEYHQQHVSPRKRILREFEKVSLEDSGVNNGAGGKRSRAKAGTTTGTTSKSSPSRSSASSISTNSTPSSAAFITSIGNNHSTTAKTTTATAAPSTRLNSSYSIHSLLGGSAGSSSSSKKSCDQPATIISNVPQQNALFSNSTYQHTLLSSPKSPERGGGKSPSHVTNKKRSPPYAANSPMHEGHSRSPSVANDFGSRSPSDSYKYPLNHQHTVHQTFYPPYGMSPQYVSAPAVAHSPTTTRMLSSTSSSSSGAATISSHIPHASMASQDLSPPRSSTASPRDPVTTPRTVPKKTASIRREFASPTASNSSTATSCPSPGDRSIASPERKTITSQLTTPNLHRSSPNALTAATLGGSPLHYYMYPPQANGATSPQTSSTSTLTAAQSQSSILGTPSSTNNSVSASAAAAAAAVAYIPSVVSPSLYHPYISTLAALRHNPFWLHPYQAPGPTPLLPPTHPHAIAQAGVGGSRLPSTFHPFPYNGVGAAAVAAAAAAAAFGPSSTPHLQIAATQSTSIPSHSNVAAVQSIQQHSPHPHHQQQQQQISALSTGAERKNHTPKLIEISTDSRNKHTKSPNASTIARSAYSPVPIGGVPGPIAHYQGLRDELSPDVPLNLSKH